LSLALQKITSKSGRRVKKETKKGGSERIVKNRDF